MATTTVLLGKGTKPFATKLGRGQGVEEQNSEGNSKATTRKEVVQQPVYFVSSLWQGARSGYSGVQKLFLGLIMASRKLRHYFQAHEIIVVTHFPLQRILRNPEATDRIVEWALELSSFCLKYESTLVQRHPKQTV